MAKNRKDYKLEVQWIKIEDIIPYPRNSKKHPGDQIQKLVAEIYHNGFDQPITVDKEMVIITGHGRHLAAKELKLDTLPVVVRDDLSEHEIIAKRIADNKLNESAWDDDFLQFEFQVLDKAKEIDLSVTAFDTKDIQKYLTAGEIGPEKTVTLTPGDLLEDESQIIVILKNEVETEELFNELKGRGYECKIM